MAYSLALKNLIVHYHIRRKWGYLKIYKLLKNDYQLSVPGIAKFLRNFKKTGSFLRKPGTGQQNRKVLTQDVINKVKTHCVSQVGKPGTHKSQWQTARLLRISRTSVQRALRYLNLKSYRRVPVHGLNNRQRAQRLCIEFVNIFSLH